MSDDRPRCASCGAYLNSYTAARGASRCSVCQPANERATCDRGHLMAVHYRYYRKDCRECARVLQNERRARARRQAEGGAA